MSSDDFAAQLAIAAKLNHQNGRQEAIVEVLSWANSNAEALQRAGLVESLLKVCSK